MARRRPFQGIVHRVVNTMRKMVSWSPFHTGLQRSTPVLRLFTRPRKKLKQKRRLATFTTWHTGLQANLLTKFQSRYRKIQKKASYQVRKLVRYTQWHTGLSSVVTNNINVIKLQTRPRRRAKQKRRLATYSIFHTASQPAVQLVYMKTRKKLGKPKRGRRLVSFFNTGHTGLSPVVGTRGTWVATYLNRRGDQ